MKRQDLLWLVKVWPILWCDNIPGKLPCCVPHDTPLTRLEQEKTYPVSWKLYYEVKLRSAPAWIVPASVLMYSIPKLPFYVNWIISLSWGDQCPRSLDDLLCFRRAQRSGQECQMNVISSPLHTFTTYIPLDRTGKQVGIRDRIAPVNHHTFNLDR